MDEIVDELARDERVSTAYEAWKETKGLIGTMYSDLPQENLPLSKCDDFKSIRNMVIYEAVLFMQDGITFEGEPSADTLPTEFPDSEIDEAPSVSDDAEPLITEDATANSKASSRNKWCSDEYTLAKH